MLRERPDFKQWVDLDTLRKLPASSLGGAYAEFMDRNRLDPLSRTPVRYIDDEELAYVMARYRDVHDLLHVLLSFDEVSVESEVHLKVAESVITGLPMTVLAALVGPLRLSGPARKQLWTRVLPWARQSCSVRMLTYPYERHMADELLQVRQELGIRERH